MKKRVMINKGQNKQDANTLLLLHGENFKDSSLYNRDIINNGVTIGNTGKFGKCFYFSSNNFIHTPIEIARNKVFTIDAWVKVSSVNSIQTFFATGRERGGLQVRANGDDLEILEENISILGVAENVIDRDDWFHLAITNTNLNINAYVNGQKVLNCGNNFKSLSNFYIGIRGELNGEDLRRGYIDEFRISNIVRWTSNFTPPTKPY